MIHSLARWRCFGALLLLSGASALGTSAQGQALFFEGGPPQLRIDRFVPGSSSATDVDKSTVLSYERAQAPGPRLKVVVSAPAVSPSASNERFELQVEALAPTAGTPQGQIRLRESMPPTDLIRDIEPCKGKNAQSKACEEQATLRYQMRATVESGPGQNEHVIQYTLQTQ
jgi:hypothetical protein